MAPTAMDLVGKSGILNLLSVEGITEAKLEGLSCYGSNVLVLIQAQVVMGATSGEESRHAERKYVECSKGKELPTFRIGRKLTQRKNWRLVLFCVKYRVHKVQLRQIAMHIIMLCNWTYIQHWPHRVF